MSHYSILEAERLVFNAPTAADIPPMREAELPAGDRVTLLERHP
ncbi:hypothetical protein [Aurantiacibacter suaedae]|nr:hypothetical protein [Aurantiacibacter suaedae]